MNSSGQVVPGSGNIYNGLQRVANGITPSQSYLVPNANDPAVLAVPAGAPRGMYPSQGTWAPRVGFAYGLTAKTIIRGGVGLFYDRIQGNPTMYTLNNPPYVGSTQFQSGNLSNITGGAAVNAPVGHAANHGYRTSRFPIRSSSVSASSANCRCTFSSKWTTWAASGATC